MPDPLRARAAQAIQDFPGAIRTAVVHEEKMQIRYSTCPFEKFGYIEATCLVVAGDDDASFSHTTHIVSHEI